MDPHHEERNEGVTPHGWLVRSRTHIGLRRSENQDFLAAQRLVDGRWLLIVADGMGGHAGGERASRLTVETVVALVQEKLDREYPYPVTDLLLEAVENANRAVLTEAERESSLKGMGTTVVLGMFDGPQGTLMNLGDSRAYVFEKDGLRQISEDHSFVAEMMRRGVMTQEEAIDHPRRNMLTRAVGAAEKPAPDFFDIRFEPGDILLLCTDGLHGFVSDGDIQRVLEADWSLEAKCDALIDAALDAGGKDNVTVLLACWGPVNHQLEAGPATDPGYAERGLLADDTVKNVSPSKRPQRWMYVVGALLLVFVAVILWGGDLFDRGSGQGEAVDSLNINPLYLDTLDLDTNDLLLDSTVQLTPSDMVNDSVWSDSLSTPAKR